MNKSLLKVVVTVLAGVSLQWSAEAGRFHFPVGISYSYGSYEVADKIFDMYERAGFQTRDEVIVPLGLSFNPYYEFDMGLGVGLSLGPTTFVVIQEETWNPPMRDQRDETRFSYIVPVGADVRYTFFREKDISPYVKIGVRYPIAGGDNISSSSTPGPYGAIGAEFLRTKRMKFGFELGYDASEVKVKGPTGRTEKVTYAGFTASLFIVF